MSPSLYDIFDILVIYDIAYITYDKNTICQYGCQKFCYDLNNATPSFKVVKSSFEYLKSETNFLTNRSRINLSNIDPAKIQDDFTKLIISEKGLSDV